MDEIALFPLSAVLFPGGLLPLRIFETRYVDMVGECMRRDQVFGVILIHDGNEAASAVSIAQVGTTARIVDFQALPDGLLGLLCRGERRFRVVERCQQPDGLNRATVEWFDDALLTPLDDEFLPLVPILRAVMAKLGDIGAFLQPRYDDASWVGHRLAEFLPLEPTVQQRLLELDDPQLRLRLLAPLIELPGAEGVA